MHCEWLLLKTTTRNYERKNENESKIMRGEEIEEGIFTTTVIAQSYNHGTIIAPP